MHIIAKNIEENVIQNENLQETPEIESVPKENDIKPEEFEKEDVYSEDNIENYDRKQIIHDVIFELKKEGIIDFSWQKYEKRKHNRRNLVK